jgi:DNA-binding IclR family transcriptional regulator
MKKKTQKGVQPGIQSVENAFGVLNALVSAGRPLRLRDIEEATGLSRNLAHAYLVSLRRVGVVLQDPETSRYDFGGMALQIGLSALSRMDFLATARSVMEQLADATGESVWLSVWSERGPVIVAKVEGRHASPFEIRIGAIADVTVTATGRSFIAHLKETHWTHIARKERTRLGSLAPSDEQLQQVLTEIRTSGIATMHEIVVPQQNIVLRQFSALAAPVFDHSQSVRAVLTVIGLSELLDCSPKSTNRRLLEKAAKNLSTRLGYLPSAAA